MSVVQNSNHGGGEVTARARAMKMNFGPTKININDDSVAVASITLVQLDGNSYLE